jgi:ribose 5-phosphate isomerase B
MCWTGTGATLAANKVPGVRAALCHDTETAKGARIWHHADVLSLSLRATPEAVAKEIPNAWLGTPFSDDDRNLRQMSAGAIAEAEQLSGSSTGAAAHRCWRRTSSRRSSTEDNRRACRVGGDD